MARKLEDVIRALADAGNFSHLSIISSGKGFHASFSPAASWGRGMAEHSDPIEAVMLAIDAAPKEGKGNKVHSSAESAGRSEPATSGAVASSSVGTVPPGEAPQTNEPTTEQQNDLSISRNVPRDVPRGVPNNPVLAVAPPVTDLMNLFKNEDNDD